MDKEKRKVLLVDDDRLILATLGEGLRQSGFDVTQADNGARAISLCKKFAPDLVILDMRMPGTDGVQVAHWLQLETTIPFIFLSAYDNDDVVEKAVNEGALGYLVKPIDVNQLLPAVRAALERGQEIRQLREKESHLNRALDSDRTTSTAVGIMMDRHRLSETQAFGMLRDRARSKRIKLTDVAEEVVTAMELLNVK
ncbi:MAG: response regulator [Pseudomonadota bacterium]